MITRGERGERIRHVSGRLDVFVHEPAADVANSAYILRSPRYLRVINLPLPRVMIPRCPGVQEAGAAPGERPAASRAA